MFYCVDGLQGAGKSYYAVSKIREKKNDYLKILTNIDSFKFEDNIQELFFNDFLEVLDECKILYDVGEDDNKLKGVLIEKGFISKEKPLLLVIDEAHNYFDKKNDLLTWFITYHRHLYIDVYLITQTYSLIHYSYHKLIQEYIHALPADRQIFGGKFKYQKHIAVPYNKQFTLAGTEYLKLDKNVFNMYQSGDKVRSKSVVRKYLYYVVALAVLGIGAFIFMIDYFFGGTASDAAKKEDAVLLAQDINTTSNFLDLDYKSVRLIELTCNVNRCSQHDYDIAFDFDLLQILVDNSGSKIISIKKNFKNSSKIAILASENFLNFFKKGVSDEKIITDNIKLF